MAYTYIPVPEFVKKRSCLNVKRKKAPFSPLADFFGKVFKISQMGGRGAFLRYDTQNVLRKWLIIKLNLALKSILT